MKRNMIRLVTLLCVFPVSGLVMAHPGHHTTGSLLGGVLHPLLGVDHVLAMLAIGLWAATASERRGWLPPLALLCVFMVTGAMLAMNGVVLPGVEAGIAVSVLVTGLLLMTLSRLNPAGGISLVALFALLHGQAHGMEMPAMAAPFLYGLGFVFTSCTLLLVGLGLGQWMRQSRADWVLRGAGVLTGGVGAWLLLGV